MNNLFTRYQFVLILIQVFPAIYAGTGLSRNIKSEEYSRQRSALQQDTSPAGLSNTFAHTHKHAKAGLAAAQFDASQHYYYGNGVSQDYNAAFYWCAQAASQDNYYAQALLGNMYVLGIGIDENQQKAFAWFLKAAQQDHLAAQAEVGRRYKFGNGVARDYQMALRWLTTASERGSAKAAHYLGVMHALGEGMPVDDAFALDCYHFAATQGFALSQATLASRYRVGDGVPRDYQKALYWFYQAASQDYVYAWFMIGRMYEMGEGVTRSRLVAYDFYRRAAEAGDDEAQLKLGLAYYRGRVLERDYAAAHNWLFKASEQENAYAQFILGRMYEDGRGVDRNPVQAVTLYERAASNGLPFASFTVGLKYFLGDGVPSNKQKALSAFERITETETDDTAMHNFSWFMIAFIHLLEGNTDDAQSALQQALSYQPFLITFIVVVILLLLFETILIAIIIAIYIIRGRYRHISLPSWGVLDAIVVLVFLLQSFVAGFILTLFSISSETFLIRALLITVGLNLIVLAVPAGMALKRRWKLRDSFSWYPVGGWSLLAWSIACVIVIFLFDILYTTTLEHFSISVPRQWLQDQVLSLTSISELQIFIFCGGVVIPVIEEFIFRGVIYKGLRAKLPAVIAVSITSLLFAVVHIEPWSFLPIFIMSFLLCYSLEKTKSIAVPIVIHSINNLVSITLLLLLEY
jgi:TPR repeat protein/membrane protease YdiL (CAAX protease family)